MIYLIIAGAVALCLGGFLVLTSVETARGVRVLSQTRSRFDRFASRAVILFTHVDFASFFRQLTHDVFHKVAHDFVVVVLQVVRMIERGLSGVTKTLRARIAPPPITPSPTEASHFVKTISYFKKTMRRSRKENGELPPQEK